MLSEIIEFIDQKLSGIGYFPKSLGLVEKHKVDKNDIPATFCKGEWKAVNIEDSFIYHRKIGTVSINELDEEQAVSCEPWQERTYSIRLVFCKKKNDLNNSSKDSDAVSQDIISEIHTLNNRILGQQLKFDTIQIQPVEIEDNIYNVYDEEFGLTDYPIDYILLYIDYEIKITGSVLCFKKLCQSDQ